MRVALSWMQVSRLAMRCGEGGIVTSPIEESRPARCVPSPQRGEGQVERGEGQDEGVLPLSICSETEPPHPNPLPSGRGSSLCQLLRTFMASASVLAAHLGARVFFLRAIETERAPEKYSHVKRETGPVQEKGRGGPAFRSSVDSVSPDQNFKR